MYILYLICISRVLDLHHSYIIPTSSLPDLDMLNALKAETLKLCQSSKKTEEVMKNEVGHLYSIPCRLNRPFQQMVFPYPRKLPEQENYFYSKRITNINKLQAKNIAMTMHSKALGKSDMSYNFSVHHQISSWSEQYFGVFKAVSSCSGGITLSSFPPSASGGLRG